jgi:hypothetical protein
VLGKAVVACIDHPSETANKYVYISSLGTTQNQILEALERATSTTWTVKHATSEMQINEAKEALGRGDFSGAFTLVKAASWSNLPELSSHFEVDERDSLFNEVLGVKSESIQQTVSRVLEGEYSGVYYV